MSCELSISCLVVTLVCSSYLFTRLLENFDFFLFVDSKKKKKLTKIHLLMVVITPRYVVVILT